MSLIDRKITSWSQSVSSLDDKPQMTAASLKAAFDSNSNELKNTLNSVIDDLTNTNAIKDIGASIDGLLGSTVFDVFASVINKLAERYTKTEADSQITTQTKDLVRSITFDEDTGIFTVIKKDGSQTQIDTALEKVPAKFELITEGTNVLLRITNIDGSTTQTDVTALMSGYTFNQSDSIAFSLSGTGNNKTVTASIRQAGVTKSMLASDATAYLEQLETQAEEQRYYAEVSAQNASQSADNALLSEQNASQSAEDAHSYKIDAHLSANEAAMSAQSAMQYSGKPPVIQNDNWYTWNAETSSYTNTGKTSRGEKGEQGKQGIQGETGRGLQILGYYNSLESLKAAQTSPNAGDAYGIGSAAPYTIYIWDSITSNWLDNGQIAFNQDGKKSARFVIGTVQSGWTSADCDYLCDGSDDQEEINTAINALPEGGGEIIILDGTYNISDTININKNNVKLTGNGDATKLIASLSNQQLRYMIIIGNASDCIISSLYMDGNNIEYIGCIFIDSCNNNVIKDNELTNSYCCIFLSGSNFNIIKNNSFNNSLYSSYLISSCNNSILSNTITACRLYLESESNNNIISHNICTLESHCSICIQYSSHNIISENMLSYNETYAIELTQSANNNTLVGNICNNNLFAIELYESNNNTVSGNTLHDNEHGIMLGHSNRNTITGNTCICGTGQTSDYADGQETISVANSNYNLISFNNIMGKNYIVDEETSVGNDFINNKYQ